MESKRNKRNLLIWDVDGSPIDGNWQNIILWKNFDMGGVLQSTISIPDLLQRNEEKYKKKFLAWLYELGEKRINDKRIIDHFEIREGFSFWWVTELAQKCAAFTSPPELVNTIKLMVFEDILLEDLPSKITLMSSDKTLGVVIGKWCKDKGISYERKCITETKDRISLRIRIFYLLPYVIQSVLILVKYLKHHWLLRKEHDIFYSSAEVLFVDYFDNLENNEIAQFKFRSKYWSKLPNIINKNGIKVNFLHLFIRHNIVPTSKDASRFLKLFNKFDTEQFAHSFIDGSLSLKTIMKTLSDYFRVFIIGIKVNGIKNLFHIEGSSINFYPILKGFWGNSLYGPACISNLLFLNLFDHFFNWLPKQKLGFYLQENQAWELALIYAWKNNGHGRIIGVPHSTIRYWDLRYFYDPRTYKYSGNCDLPMPDVVAVNGPVALNTYIDAGYPQDQIQCVEALRYLYLENIRITDKKEIDNDSSTINVLVLGDYSSKITYQQMNWLSESLPLLKRNFQFVVKPHPNCPIVGSNFPKLKLIIRHDNLNELFGICDLVYTNNVTSAGLDAYLSGIPVISIISGDAFNMSPLKGLEGVIFVKSYSELANALNEFSKCSCRRKYDNYFSINSNLTLWSHLIESTDNEK